MTRGVEPRLLLSPVGCKTSVVVFSRPYLSNVDPEKEGREVKARNQYPADTAAVPEPEGKASPEEQPSAKKPF